MNLDPINELTNFKNIDTKIAAYLLFTTKFLMLLTAILILLIPNITGFIFLPTILCLIMTLIFAIKGRDKEDANI